MSESLETLLAAEARAAELLERAAREAQGERASIPEALSELETRYESALAAAEERETSGIVQEVGTYHEQLRQMRMALEEELRDKSRELDSEAFRLLRARMLRGG